MKSRHTPGEWTMRRKSVDFAVVIEANTPTSSKWICTCPMPPDGTSLRGEDEANVRLIMAAPKLLVALQDLRREIRAHHKMNVKKDYSLMVADVVADKAIIEATGQLTDAEKLRGAELAEQHGA